ncbi:anti-sigma factor family protein [Anaeromicropila herbilytica]|uniref:Zf-HC2 domain-containing protein n=1 Tax=Anaeromicropila herbilytica TaxID=2785025 RepID=A0A7R7ICE8_9FIRM|nr:hypothetical protein [Anaeromicropila herbilytica]BCN30532.1 hypothetical protein bsdtb5_18270 [Anaeromicropila herbilytica]
MTCIEAQSLITPFINDELDIQRLEAFMNHINHCGECKEELEVYYTLLTGMKQLDDDKNLSGDFHMHFINKLKKTEERIKRKKLQKVRKRIILICSILMVSIITSISIKEYVVDDIINEEQQQQINSNDIHLRYYFFRDRDSDLERYITQNYEKIIKLNTNNPYNIKK